MLFKYWKYLKLAVLILVPLAILIFPLETFINSPAICDPNDPNYNSCGIWQAIYSFLHLDFEAGSLYNSRGFVMGPLIAGLSGWELWDEVKDLKKS
ncbi:hypothetical protein [Jiulongibacter sediminis]|uniref:Uncharacterized protein n=1 Tax=Jiulongibacter sediminis TaxID=1605367 RepID=A0A0P7BCN9_9BACT|nr:hypothetical protein [Jiulongibacter sediminis]KPM48366.1 hypothetical protein AFM12_06890 [Jiulongibacter sediminis]TBX24903.1 hypothetical protein TK44_06895 [Jiulongibacter sediminis]